MHSHIGTLKKAQESTTPYRCCHCITPDTETMPPFAQSELTPQLLTQEPHILLQSLAGSQAEKMEIGPNKHNRRICRGSTHGNGGRGAPAPPAGPRPRPRDSKLAEGKVQGKARQRHRLGTASARRVLPGWRSVRHWQALGGRDGLKGMSGIPVSHEVPNPGTESAGVALWVAPGTTP